ncbi:SDA1-like protein [Drosera capensis]
MQQNREQRVVGRLRFGRLLPQEGSDLDYVAQSQGFCELKVWFDDRTATAICLASLHPSSKILEAALQFLLDYEKIEDDDESDASSSEDDALQFLLDFEKIEDDDESDASSSEDDATPQKPQVVLSKEDVYKANHKGENDDDESNRSHNWSSPVDFAPVLSVPSKIVQPHQKDVTNLLAAAVQACHDMVPPDAVEPLFRQLVNHFVHDRLRSESIAVGLNVVREARIPLLMTKELLQDLVLYKKSHDKAVSSAAQSLVTLFREICPSLLVKKYRGRPIDPKARPKAFGEVNVASNVAGIEKMVVVMILMAINNDPTGDGNESDYDSDIEANTSGSSEADENDSDAIEDVSDDDAKINSESEDELKEDDEAPVDENGCSSADEVDSVSEAGSSDDMNDDVELHHDSGDEISIGKKRKLSDFDGQLNAADSSLQALKKIAATISDVASDGILSDEHFQRIEEKKAKEEAKFALLHHGLLEKGSDSKSASFKIPSSEQLSMKRVDPAKLEARRHRKLTKEQRMELVRAGREEGGKYQARTAMKQKKVVTLAPFTFLILDKHEVEGWSEQQAEGAQEKAMPMAAKRAKVKRNGQEKKRKQARSKKQFRWKKAWK